VPTLATVASVFFWLPNHDVPGFGWVPKTNASPHYGWAFFIYRTLKALNAWCWILAICGYALHYLNFTNPFLRYANRAVYPFYILHQSVMLPLGYWVLKLDWGPQAKFWLIAAGMFLITWGLYELLRRTALTRLLFGMRAEAPLRPGAGPLP
jgi:glucans biosynthesis protein C